MSALLPASILLLQVPGGSILWTVVAILLIIALLIYIVRRT